MPSLSMLERGGTISKKPLEGGGGPRCKKADRRNKDAGSGREQSITEATAKEPGVGRAGLKPRRKRSGREGRKKEAAARTKQYEDFRKSQGVKQKHQNDTQEAWSDDRTWKKRLPLQKQG